MQATLSAPVDTRRYAKTIEASRRVRWDIDRDVIRGREFDLGQEFMPDRLSLVSELDFLSPDQRRFLGQVQGRTYANMFGLVERFIGAKMAEVGRDHALGDQTAFEAVVRFTDEELKHQELFRRLEGMTAPAMPAGYTFVPQPNDVASAVLSKCTWAVLALTCCIELFTQAHYRQSIEPDAELSELWKDVFRFHWLEESQHAILDELEWRRESERLGPEQRDHAVDDLIALVGAVDGIAQTQAAADSDYFLRACGRVFSKTEADRIKKTMLAAYRWQYVASGAQDERFLKILGALTTADQMKRIGAALAAITN